MPSKTDKLPVAGESEWSNGETKEKISLARTRKGDETEPDMQAGRIVEKESPPPHKDNSKNIYGEETELNLQAAQIIDPSMPHEGNSEETEVENVRGDVDTLVESFQNDTNPNEEGLPPAEDAKPSKESASGLFNEMITTFLDQDAKDKKGKD